MTPRPRGTDAFGAGSRSAIMKASRSVVAVALAVLAGSVPAGADGSRTASADLAVEFLVDEGFAPSSRAGGDAWMDLGRLAATWDRHARRAGSTLVARRVAVRVTSRSGRRGFVRLVASLGSGEPGGPLRVDGALLTAAPRVVDALMPIGATVPHQIELELLPSAPPGTFAVSITWEIEER